MNYTGDGTNLDCIHPVQDVLDALSGDNRRQYAVHLESWFESYSEARGIKAKAFTPMSSFVTHLHII